MAATFDGGVVLGADSRTSTGSYVANRATDKVTRLTERVYVCRSGSAAGSRRRFLPAKSSATRGTSC